MLKVLQIADVFFDLDAPKAVSIDEKFLDYLMDSTYIDFFAKNLSLSNPFKFKKLS